MKSTKAFFGAVAMSALLAGCGGGESEPAAPAETTAATSAAVETPAPVAEAPADLDPMATTDGVTYASLTGDAGAGKIVFAQCQSCHSVEAGVNKTGPSLAGIVGRQAGTIEGFNYSPANKNSGITWTEEQMYVYLENPQRVVPKTKMIYPGLREAQKRADVIAYLKNPV